SRCTSPRRGKRWCATPCATRGERASAQPSWRTPSACWPAASSPRPWPASTPRRRAPAWGWAFLPSSCSPGSSSRCALRRRRAPPSPSRRPPSSSRPRLPSAPGPSVPAAAASRAPSRRGGTGPRRAPRFAWPCSSVVSRCRLRLRARDLLRALALPHLVVPDGVVLPRPFLVDVALAHGAVRSFHADGAHVDVAEGGANEEHRADDVDHVRRLHRLAHLVPVGEVEDEAGHRHRDAEDRHAAPEPHLLHPVEAPRGHLASGEHAAEIRDPLPVPGPEQVVLHEDQEADHDREDEERPHEVVQVL